MNTLVVKTHIDVSALYDEIPRVLNTDILHLLNEARFTETNFKQLSRFVKTLNSQMPKFIRQLHVENNPKWFENDIVKGISVVLSFFGLALTVCVLVICCRHHKLSG